jgi:hypothetical protein
MPTLVGTGSFPKCPNRSTPRTSVACREAAFTPGLAEVAQSAVGIRTEKSQSHVPNTAKRTTQDDRVK